MLKSYHGVMVENVEMLKMIDHYIVQTKDKVEINITHNKVEEDDNALDKLNLYNNE